MELTKVLEKLDLNEKEAKTYLAMLEIGRGSVQVISRRAKIKRPTTYIILEDLRDMGLVSLIKGADTTIYTAESPEQILARQKRKENIINDNLPALLAIFNTKKEKPKVRFYEGKDRIVDLYNNVIFKSKKVDMFGSINAINANVLDQIWWNLERIEKKKIKVREILQSDEASIKFAKKHSSEMHQIKNTPKAFKFPTDNVVFDNKLIIFSYKDLPMAVVIESNDVAITYKNMFELIWQNIT
ncbi:MAG: helix-turn-helix domain-containing protein [bacterium]|nr:helix-turn-helix domain-containing protein [bacterium]